MKKKAVLLITLMALALMTLPLMSTVQAKITEETHYGPPDDGFTEYYGALGGANFFVLIPDSWNGMLVVMCRGAGYTEDPREYWRGFSMLELWV